MRATFDHSFLLTKLLRQRVVDYVLVYIGCCLGVWFEKGECFGVGGRINEAVDGFGNGGGGHGEARGEEDED